MIHRPLALFAIILALASACASTRPVEQILDQGVYALVVRGDTTLVEEFTRTPRLLEGLVTPRGTGAPFGWARYRLELDAAGEVERAELRLGPPWMPSDEAGTVVYTVTLSAGVLLEEGSNGTVREAAVPRGTLPLFAPSIAMHDEVIRLALRRAGRTPAAIPIRSFPETGRLDTLRVTWAGDTALVAHPGAPPSRFRVTSEGAVTALGTTDGEFLIVRR
jgi:hypothetical protein